MGQVVTGVVVLDCAEPEQLAVFYQEFLGAEQTGATANRIEVRSPDGLRLAFRRDANVTPSSWPRPENSFQVHLDFLVDDLDEAERTVIGLGGRALETSNAQGRFEERGYSDPAGHTFTLRLMTDPSPKQG
jgi:hypothetical protein